MTNKYSVAWAAGIFDGSGCVSIGRIHPSAKRTDIVNTIYTLTTKVTAGRKETIDHFRKIVGHGSLHTVRPTSAGGSNSHVWIAMARKSETVLRLLRPYLVTKAKEADIALEFMALPDLRVKRHGDKKQARRLLAERLRIYLECRRLKPRWKTRKNRPVATPELPRKLSAGSF